MENDTNVQDTNPTPTSSTPTEHASGGGRRGFFSSTVRRNSGGIEEYQPETSRTETGTGTTRKPGRPKLPRDANGNIIRDAAAGNPSQQRTGNPGNAEGGNGTTASSAEEEKSAVGEAATVESPTEKPRRGRPRKQRGNIQPEHVEKWTTQLFNTMAMMKNQSHWKVANPEIEIRPWSPDAAEMLNKLDTRATEKVAAISSATAVIVGISAMVMVRMDADRRIKEHIAQEQQEVIQRTHPQEPPIMKQPSPIVFDKANGARTVHPDKIEGIGKSNFG